MLAGSESVQTPREVYDRLKKEGYRVQYYRLPLTDGEAPKERIFDVFYHHVKDVPPSDALIFNCQMGGGRTTTGMVIGCLIRMHTSGQLLSALKHAQAFIMLKTSLSGGSRPASHAPDASWLRQRSIIIIIKHVKATSWFLDASQSCCTTCIRLSL